MLNSFGSNTRAVSVIFLFIGKMQGDPCFYISLKEIYMAERKAFNSGNKTTSNYVVVPGQCQNCKHFSNDNTTTWGPYVCKAGSTASGAYKAGSSSQKNQTFDTCKCFTK
jgi:hypothetical protein